MLEILSDSKTTIVLPRTFNSDTMYAFMAQAITPEGNVRYKTVNFDFLGLEFIEPVGVVVLSNLVEFLRRAGASGSFQQVWANTSGVVYLDNSGFFARYHGRTINPLAKCGAGTLPLTLVQSLNMFNFLNSTMIPWIARTLGISEAALATVRVCLEEILQNVGEHSGVDVGCVHAQYFPGSSALEIAISDFGFGIPSKVREYGERPDAKPEYGISASTTDAEALKLACIQGFTTSTNVKNRGAGLPNLLRVVTGADRGTVWIVSGQGVISAAHRNGASKLTARTRPAVYPGTLVRVILKTNVVRDFEKDIELEEFSWN